jgi:hypothetical protein
MIPLLIAFFLQAAADSASRCVAVAESPDARVAPTLQIAPGPPPLLSFRYYEGKLHHRYGNADLMLDDAGH